MFPQNLFYIAGYGVNLYLLCHILGVIPALVLAVWLLRERRAPLPIVFDVFIVGIVGALGAALLFFALTRSFLPTLPTLWGFPAIAGFLLAIILYGVRHPLRRARGVSVLVPLDVVFAPLALYQAITRLGCFSAGCCHGKPICPECHFPFAITFADSRSASIYQGIPLYPTQLMFALGDALIALVLLALRNKPALRGALIWIYLCGYGLLRFGVEFLRGDVRTMVGDLYLSQVIGLALALVGAGMLARRFAFAPRATSEHAV